MQQKVQVLVVPHTHWDREWYLSFEKFRPYLIEALDRVLEMLEKYPNYQFTLDGQVIPLLDYLEIKPENEARVRQAVQSGRLHIGPWYTQPDEFLVSGEALVRNLLLGTQIAKKFGGVMLQGYVPDAFGHIAQLPQILRGFGIDTAFVMRGAEHAAQRAGAADFLWSAPDGSTVQCHVLETGYCNAEHLDKDPYALTRPLAWLRKEGLLDPSSPALVQFLQRLIERSKTGIALLLNGCDHRAPQPDIVPVLEALNERLDRFEFRIGSLNDYAEILRENASKLALIQGELRQSKFHPILSGVLSTRMYIKQANFEVQNKLERYAEPLAALALLRGKDFRPLLKKAWMVLLQNHAHDSICGTGVDEVHEEMMHRFRQASALADAVTERGLKCVAESFEQGNSNESSIIVFNPTLWPSRAEVEVLISDDSTGFLLQDSEQKLIPFVEKGVEEVPVNILEGVGYVRKKRICFQDRLPPLGLKSYRLVKAHSRFYESSVKAVGNVIENDFYIVRVNPDGTFDVYDKENEKSYEGVNVLEDTADAGDEYNFSPLLGDIPITNIGLRGKVVSRMATPWKAEVTVSLRMRLPMRLTSDRKRRSKRGVSLPIRWVISLQEDVKRIDVHMDLENKAYDHRLRVAFPTGLDEAQVFVDETFGVFQRLLQPLDEPWVVEKPSSTFPQKMFVVLEKSGVGFALINRGLPECEVTKNGTIFLTLLRSVGWLSRGDLLTRRGQAGPSLPTPNAQCPGLHHFDYAIYTFKGKWQSSKLPELAHSFCIPPIGIEYPGLPLLSASFLQCDSPQIVLSVIKPAEEGEYIVVRLYNPTGEVCEASVKTLWEIAEVWEVRLDETEVARVKPMASNEFKTVFRGWEIKTFKISFKEKR
jgi:mannosylglycerate hydrolase